MRREMSIKGDHCSTVDRGCSFGITNACSYFNRFKPLGLSPGLRKMLPPLPYSSPDPRSPSALAESPVPAHVWPRYLPCLLAVFLLEYITTFFTYPLCLNLSLSVRLCHSGGEKGQMTWTPKSPPPPL